MPPHHGALFGWVFGLGVHIGAQRGQTRAEQHDVVCELLAVLGGAERAWVKHQGIP